MHVDVIYKGCCTDILSKFKVFCVWKHDIQLNTVTSCIYYKPIFCLFITFFFLNSITKSFPLEILVVCDYSLHI